MDSGVSPLYASSNTSPPLRSLGFSPPGIERGDECCMLVGLALRESPMILFSGVTARIVLRMLALCMEYAGSLFLPKFLSASNAFACRSSRCSAPFCGLPSIPEGSILLIGRWFCIDISYRPTYPPICNQVPFRRLSIVVADILSMICYMILPPK